jgi:hypothetical protein
MNKQFAIFKYIFQNYAKTLWLLLMGLLVFILIFKCFVSPESKTNIWDKVFDPALTLTGLISPILIWLYFIGREWRASLDEKLIVHFTIPSPNGKGRDYVMSAYNVYVVKGGDIRLLAQQIGQQMSKTQFLKFSPSIQKDEVVKIKDIAGKFTWIRCQEIEILLDKDGEPEGDPRNNIVKPLLGKYVVWNYFDEDKLSLNILGRPQKPWHENNPDAIPLAELLSLDNDSRERFLASNPTQNLSENKLYLLNSPICTDFGLFDFQAINQEKAKEIFLDFHQKNKVVSAIGHEGTTNYLSEIFQQPIQPNRIEVQMMKGDWALVIKIPRQAIGANLNIEELKNLNPTLGMMKKLN